MFTGRYFPAPYFAPRYFPRKVATKGGRTRVVLVTHDLGAPVSYVKKVPAFSEHKEADKLREHWDREALTKLVLFLDTV